MTIAPLAVPVRRLASGAHTLRLARLPDGTRVGLAFTTCARAREVLGSDCELTELSLGAVHDLLTPLGVAQVQVDPVAVGSRRPLGVAS